MEDFLQEQETSEPLMLHIVDGESVAGTLRQSRLPGRVMIYGDLLYEGPVPAGLEARGWNEVRARFYSDAGYTTMEEASRIQLTWQRTLESCSVEEEVVLWTDHRLTDQLILLRVLDWLSHEDLGKTRISLISVGRYPGIDSFVTLGQLRNGQLASLADTRLRVTDAQFRLAQAAWRSFTSTNPTEIEQVIHSDTSALPFLDKALRRHLQQFPSVQNGLSLTEHLALSILHEHGALSAVRLFFAVQRAEELLFMGDNSFYRLLIGMASGENPLVQTANTEKLKLRDRNSAFEDWTNSPVTLTETGLRVLSGLTDYVRLNGINRWLGGVNLCGGEASWRWNHETSRLVGVP